MDISLRKLQEIMKDREAWHAIDHGTTKSWTQLSDWTASQIMEKEISHMFHLSWLNKSFCLLASCSYTARTIWRKIHNCPESLTANSWPQISSRHKTQSNNLISGMLSRPFSKNIVSFMLLFFSNLQCFQTSFIVTSFTANLVWHFIKKKYAISHASFCHHYINQFLHLHLYHLLCLCCCR